MLRWPPAARHTAPAGRRSGNATVGDARGRILAAIRLGLSNARLEGLNNKVRLISHRSYGFHGPDPLIALIYLCAGGIIINPPFTANPRGEPLLAQRPSPCESVGN